MALTDALPHETDTAAEPEMSERARRLEKQAAAVKRRSRRIALLRTFIPVAIILLIVLNFGWITIQNLISGMNIYHGAAHEDRMTNPRFSGLSNVGDHYTISGLEATRNGQDATVITMKSPVMDYKGDTDRPTHISADAGLYDQNAQTFTLTGDVVMKSGGTDMTFKTEQAVVDLANSTFHGNKHIEGDGSLGHIVGESFIIRDAGRDVTFTGNGDRKVLVTIPQ